MNTVTPPSDRETRVTGSTDQLVAEGLVVRDPEPMDRRAYLLKLTPKGRRVFGAMAAAHEPWIVELFGGLDGRGKERMYSLLASLKGHILTVTTQAAGLRE